LIAMERPSQEGAVSLNWGRAPILLLHEVLPDSTQPLPPYAITQSHLREVLRDFTGRGYSSGTLEDAVYGRRGGKRLVLTFDDGTHDFIEHALPVLAEFEFKATLFIVGGLIGKMRRWEGGSDQPLVDPVPLMDARELRELHDSGFTIASHTMTHPRLPRLTEEQIKEEVSQSREVLEDLTGARGRWFAYPYLAMDDRTEAAVRRAGYDAACGGLLKAHSLYNLNRVEVSVFTLPDLKKQCNGLYHMARQAMRQARGKG
jgi:peptidoglycan/xylan/chitin deacetylase (PgdA/CDA1 family)